MSGHCKNAKLQILNKKNQAMTELFSTDKKYLKKATAKRNKGILTHSSSSCHTERRAPCPPQQRSSMWWWWWWLPRWCGAGGGSVFGRRHGTSASHGTAGEVWGFKATTFMSTDHTGYWRNRDKQRGRKNERKIKWKMLQTRNIKMKESEKEWKGETENTRKK